MAVSGITVTSLTNGEVEAGQTATHTLEYEADGISADGATDTLYVEFRNRTSGTTVSVSSSTSIVDGPDDDGVRETLRTGISKDADYPTDDIEAVYEFSLTHPRVEETTASDVRIVAADSMTESSETAATDALTVVAGDSMATATATETATPTTAVSPTENDGPGFGVTVDIVALLATGLLVGRRE